MPGLGNNPRIPTPSEVRASYSASEFHIWFINFFVRGFQRVHAEYRGM